MNRPMDRCGETKLSPNGMSKGMINFQPGKNVKSLKSSRTSCVSRVNVLYNVNVSINEMTSTGVAPQYNRVGTTRNDIATPEKRAINADRIPNAK